jgi:hypothetical protein
MKFIYHIHYTDGRFPNCLATLYTQDMVIVDEVFSKMKEIIRDDLCLIPQKIQE